MRELDSLKNICSVNYSLKSVIWFSQAHINSNIDTNGNEMQIFDDFACLYGTNEVFLWIVYWRKVFQGVKLSHIRLVLPIYSNFENTHKYSIMMLGLRKSYLPRIKDLPHTITEESSWYLDHSLVEVEKYANTIGFVRGRLLLWPPTSSTKAAQICCSFIG